MFVYQVKQSVKINGTYGTRGSYGCCNNTGTFQIVSLINKHAKLVFPWTVNSNGGICIFSLLPCGQYARRKPSLMIKT